MQTVLSAFLVLPTIPQTFPHFWIPHFTFRIPHFTNNPFHHLALSPRISPHPSNNQLAAMQ